MRRSSVSRWFHALILSVDAESLTLVCRTAGLVVHVEGRGVVSGFVGKEVGYG
jgi:hypothetical protein